MLKTALSSTRKSDYGQWYQDVISNAELAEHSMTRGCMILKPWGYALWERCQQVLDKKFKDTGHQNVYFPLLIPLSCFQKEAEHIDGFAKECAVVTHHRLKKGKNGELIPDGELEEPYIIRPTSEMIIGEAFSRWVESYRDLPLLINQWANVMRWEMRTRLFIRTTEFLWQEGHTAHSTAEEAKEETLAMLNVYEQFLKNTLALPALSGSKPAVERFPGAVDTLTIETMTQNGKALQAGTSHFMGQTFAKACSIKFLNKSGVQEHAWTTSWGVTTRLIGSVIMAHADDNGLVLPPSLAPYQIVIIPILKDNDSDTAVLDYCKKLRDDLQSLSFEKESVRVYLDTRDKRSGDKKWAWVKKGVPIRLEMGSRDIASNQVCVSLREKDMSPTDKSFYSVSDFMNSAVSLLDKLQLSLWNMAIKTREENTHFVESAEQLESICHRFQNEEESAPGFLECFLADCMEIEELLKKYGLTPRCMPLSRKETGTCILTGAANSPLMILAKAY